MSIATIILAAGKGTRMRSEIPKVMHKIADKPLLKHVYDLASTIKDNTINIVYGHGAEIVLNGLQELNANWIEQKQQLGTGHAVQQVSDLIADLDTVLILYGDVPLLQKNTIETLLLNVTDKSMGLLTVILENPKGYGRIVRNDQGKVEKIIEEKDATETQKAITEINTGIMAVNGAKLKKWLSQLNNQNAQGEYYLTDIIEMAVKEQIEVRTNQPNTEFEVMGINDRLQLSQLERVYQKQQAENIMLQGVTLRDPNRFDQRGTIEIKGQDIEIDINVIFDGQNIIGNQVKIGANTRISNTIIGDNVEILDHCVIDNATIGSGSRIGPFARLRPETELSSNVHIGNFVEIKKSTVDQNSKINHLSYIGDTMVGSNVNIGAGTITCNYDGVNKFRTIIEDGAFIGSDTQLIAPVKVGKNVTIGAGSTITKDCPEGKLTLSRAKQTTITEWQRPIKKGS